MGYTPSLRHRLPAFLAARCALDGPYSASAPLLPAVFGRRHLPARAIKKKSGFAAQDGLRRPPRRRRLRCRHSCWRMMRRVVDFTAHDATTTRYFTSRKSRGHIALLFRPHTAFFDAACARAPQRRRFFAAATAHYTPSRHQPY